MGIIRFAIANPVKVAVGVILVLLFGVVALSTIPIQLTPDVDRPLISIRTRWPGRSPEEVEETILIEQEEKLKAIQGLYKMTSTAQLGEGIISLEFNIGTNMARAIQETSNKLDEVPDYPEDVDRPIVKVSDSASDNAVGYLLIQSRNDENYEVADFYDHADRFLKPVLERIDGVSEIQIMGGREHEVHIRVDPKALAQRGISVSQLAAALRADNVNDSAGDLASGRLDVRFRVLGQYTSLEPIRKTIVKYDENGAPIRVEDVAEVKLTLEKNVHFDQSKGRPSMTIFVKRETGSNVLKIMNEVQRQIEFLNGPDGPLRQFKNDRYKLYVRLLTDDSRYIYQALAVVRRNLLFGGALAVLMLLLFLRNGRSTLIVAVAIPVSVIGTFVVMALTGRNINIISLAGLSFAVGMVVDNAIVALENIDRHLGLGEPPREAAYRGTREVWGAILASTLTTIAVFGPVLTIREETGQLYYDIALAICAAVLLSLIVSVTVIPVAASRLLRPPKISHGRLWREVHDLFGLVPLLGWFADRFSRMIHLLTFPSISGVWARIVVIGTILTASVALVSLLTLPASYLPNGNKNVLFARMFNPPGYSMEQNKLVGQRLEAFVRPYWEAETSRDTAKLHPLRDKMTGELVESVAPLDEFFFVIYRNRVFMITTCKDPQRPRSMTPILDEAIAQIPGARGMVQQASIFGRRAGGSNTVEVEVVGNNLERLRSSAAQLFLKLMERFAMVRSDPITFNESAPELRLMIDQVRAKELGLSVSSLADTARMFVDGTFVGDFSYEGDNIDMLIIRDPNVKITPEEMLEAPIAVEDSDGENGIIPLRQIAKFVSADASQSIRRVEQQRAVTFYVTPPLEVALEEAEEIISELVEECRREGGMTSDITVNLAGNADKLSQTRRALVGNWNGWNPDSLRSIGLSRFFLAILITYLLMAALFESFLYPLVIMVAVPPATVGGFVGLRLVKAVDPTQQMDTLTMLGFIILVGVVVNNAILIVHQALNFMRGLGEGESDHVEKMPPREAIRQSVRTRIRPIFMTTATSVFGMLPLVLAPGAGSELYRGLGSVVVGGLICATPFTLIVVPLLFSLVLDVRVRLGGLRDCDPIASP